MHESMSVNMRAFLKHWEQRANTFWEVSEFLAFKLAVDFLSSIRKITSSGFFYNHVTSFNTQWLQVFGTLELKNEWK